MQELESRLIESSGARRIMIATDGVFSMDGYFARLDEICCLASKYGAMVMIDDSHAAGFVGPTGRGTPEHFSVTDQVDVTTGTLGKALGGASGGYTSGRQEIIDLLRQRSRPCLFSNSVAPVIVAASLKAIHLIEEGGHLRTRLRNNTTMFRSRMTAAGFDVLPGEHPIAPVMYGDARAAIDASAQLLEDGIYAIPFSYPVVPKGRARIRIQPAAHTTLDIEHAIAAFERTSARKGDAVSG
jgi:glycine C-acetyltransferase